MLTRLRVTNFKRFSNADIELGKAVVLIGPNNSGKTTILQALALWQIGLREWTTKRTGGAPEKRPGVTINSNDLIPIPTPDVKLLWHDLHVRNVRRDQDKKQRTQNVRVGILVDGVSSDRTWSCGLEFDFANPESFYCRPLTHGTEKAEAQHIVIPDEAVRTSIAFLPAMSGLAAVEPKWEQGRINVLLGEGQTAQVLRNLCFRIYDQTDGTENWDKVVEHIADLFGVTLLPPRYVMERGEITMSYREKNGVELDLSASGRGLQQTLLLLTHMYSSPKTVLLLDEPDAHLEFLRQRQIYRLITDIAEANGSQIIAASHSEVILNEAADRDIVIAFVGNPHRIDDRGSQVAKALKEIGFDQYYLAEQNGWVLYLEGSTDLAILQTLARVLNHEAAPFLERPFVRYVENQPQRAKDHFFGLREACPGLRGVALFDRLERGLPADSPPLVAMMWNKREVENYIASEKVLLSYANHAEPDDLFTWAEAEHRQRAMLESMDEMATALKTLRKPTPWSDDIKVTDDYLDPLFALYFEKLGLPNLLRKTDYHILASFVQRNDIAQEITEKLDAIVAVARQITPRAA